MRTPTALADWFRTEIAPSQAEFARSIKCSESHLSLIVAGKREPSLALAKRISDRTGGSVPLDALVLSDPIALTEAAE